MGAPDKFWFIQDLQSFLLSKKLSIPISDLITFVVVLVCLFICLWGIDIILGKIVTVTVHSAVKKTKTLWDDFLAKRKFFRRAIRLILCMMMSYLIEFFLTGYDPHAIKAAVLIFKCLSVVYLLKSLISVADASYDIYNTLDRAKEKSIKGYIQTIKIVLYIMAILIIIIMIFGLSTTKFVTGFAASAALFTLIFKDTILGFVSSIQLNLQEMIKLGDWIQMDSQNANGIVEDISVTTVRIRNWDNTYANVPIYSMISQSFINWRGMLESEGRRFIRTIYIDTTCVRELSADEMKTVLANSDMAEFYSEYSKTMEKDDKLNIYLFRQYIKYYLINNTKVNSSLDMMIRYNSLEDKGIPLEIYAFTYEKSYLKQADVVNIFMEHFFMAATILNVKIYQRVTTYNIDNVKINNNSI